MYRALEILQLKIAFTQQVTVLAPEANAVKQRDKQKAPHLWSTAWSWVLFAWMEDTVMANVFTRLFN